MPYPVKSLLLFAALMMPTGSKCLAEFSITGILEGAKAGDTLTLYREDLGNRSRSIEGEFTVLDDSSFSKRFPGEPGLFSLEISGQQKIQLAIGSDQDLTITLSTSGLDVSGSLDHQEFQAYEAYRKESLARLVYPPRRALNDAKERNAPQSELAELAKQEVQGYQAHLRELNDYTLENLSQPASLYASSLRWDPDHRLDELEYLAEKIGGSNSNLKIVRTMQQKIKKFSRTAIGTIAPDLSGVDLEGQTQSLSSLHGEYVLVDFWASWCTPCHVENRHYVKLLSTYSKNGFSIFAVNLDSSKPRWKRASEIDGVTWPQISDQLSLASPLAEAYNVTALPVNYLLDPEGRIIAKNLRGDELDAKLQELFSP